MLHYSVCVIGNASLCLHTKVPSGKAPISVRTKQRYSSVQNLIKRLISAQTCYECPKTHKRTQSDGVNPSCLPCLSFSLFHVAAFLLRRIYDNRQRATRTTAGKVDRWCVYECVWVCEHGRPCVGQRDCKVIPYTTRVPAMLHNRHNTSTLMSSQLFL